VLSTALSQLAQKRVISIEQLFLEKGHTMIEADSVHSTLETMFGNGPIYAPSDYYALMRVTRPKQPYEVHILDYTYFKDFDHGHGFLHQFDRVKWLPVQ